MHDQHCRVWNQRFQLRARSTVELVCGGLREKQLPVPLTWSFDLCRGSTNQTYGGRAFLSPSLSFSLSLSPSLSLSISLSLEQRLTFGQGALSWDRKDWSKKRVFVLRKFIYFTLKIKCLFFFPSDQKRTLWNVGEKTVLFLLVLLEHPPKSTFLLHTINSYMQRLYML